MLFSDLPQPDIYVLNTRDTIAQFCTDVVGMSNHDYDIHELLSMVVTALDRFDSMEDEIEDVIASYQVMEQLSPEGVRDFAILAPAIRKLHAGIRAHLDYFDVRDSTGVLEYRYADLRSNNELLLVSKKYQYSDSGVTSYPAPGFDPTIVTTKSSLGQLLGPDNGYNGTEYIGVADSQ
jgi:hypothetical protein